MQNTKGRLFVTILLFSNFIKAKRVFYILNWGSTKLPLWYINGGQYFTDMKCKYSNCFITNNNSYFTDKTMFDAYIFDAVDLRRIKQKRYLPSGKFRSETQKYIFTTIESEVNYPLCAPFFNNFFNWTWTYRLDSTFSKGFITVYNKNGKKIGPNRNMKWRKQMDPIKQELKEQLQHKTRLAAWFVSRCKSKGKREEFVRDLQIALKELGGQPIDVFGKCGWYNCPNAGTKCARMLKRDYIFYLAFENSFSEDYVTEQLMTALDNFSIPVVYGGANYARFLPPGSYLNARELGPQQLARKMIEISDNVTLFHDFFRWRNHIEYKGTSNMCNLCAIINSRRRGKKSVIEDFVKWWNKGLC